MWFLSFWILPIISACTWLGMLLAMLIVWLAEGSPRYASMERGQRIAQGANIALNGSVPELIVALDIGAQGLKPLFIAGCCVTTIFLDLSFAAERWLRHTGRLARNSGPTEAALSVLSIIFAIAGTCGLILLSVFDTLRHPRLHDGFLLLFMGGYVISAIFICAEYQRLGVHFRQHRVLRASFWLKLAFIIVEIGMAIAFIVCSYRTSKNAGAVLEWVVALIFTFYVFTFFIDLLPAVRTKHHPSSAPQVELGHNSGGAHFTDGHDRSIATGEYGYMNEGRMNGTQDSMVTSHYYGDGSTTRMKPAPAQNF